MRRAVLRRSVERLLPDEIRVIDVVFMWSRHRLMIPFVVVAFVAMLALAEILGYEGWGSRMALGVAAAAIAVTATTEYRVLAQTTEGLVLLRASRVRQYATKVLEPLPDDTPIDPAGGTVIANDWSIGGHLYTVPKSSEQALNRIIHRAD